MYIGVGLGTVLLPGVKALINDFRVISLYSAMGEVAKVLNCKYLPSLGKVPRKT